MSYANPMLINEPEQMGLFVVVEPPAAGTAGPPVR